MNQEIDYQKEARNMQEIINEKAQRLMFDIRTKICILLSRYYLHGEPREIVITFIPLHGVIDVELLVDEGGRFSRYKESIQLEVDKLTLMRMAYEELKNEGYQIDSKSNYTNELRCKLDDIVNSDVAMMWHTLNDLRKQKTEKYIEEVVDSLYVLNENGIFKQN